MKVVLPRSCTPPACSAQRLQHAACAGVAPPPEVGQHRAAAVAQQAVELLQAVLAGADGRVPELDHLCRQQGAWRQVLKG